MTEKKEKRTRSREIPMRCKLRLCRPNGAECPICKRLIFPTNIHVEKGGL